MATHSSILAWRIPCTEVPGRLHSPQCRKESDATEVTQHRHTPILLCCHQLIFSLLHPRLPGKDTWQCLMLDMGLSFMTFIILSYIPSMGFPGGSVVKNPPANARDADSIPGSGSSPGEGNSNPLEYSYLGNPMDRGTWWATPTWGHKRVRHNLATKQQHSLYTHFVESFYHK